MLFSNGIALWRNKVCLPIIFALTEHNYDIKQNIAFAVNDSENI